MKKVYAVMQFSTCVGEAVAVFESKDDALYFARRLNNVDGDGESEDSAKYVYELPLIPADTNF